MLIPGVISQLKILHHFEVDETYISFDKINGFFIWFTVYLVKIFFLERMKSLELEKWQ